MAQAGIVGSYSQLISSLLYAAGFLWRVLAHRPRRPGPLDPQEIRSILLIRLDEMGDFTLFSSMLRPLRRAFPDARITLVLCDWICPLAELCPYVDEVIPFPSRGPKWLQYLLGPFRALRIALRLGRSIDLAVNSRFDRDIRGAAFLAHFSLAPWVLGFPSSTEPFKVLANRGYDRFYTHLLPAPVGARHETERTRVVLDALGIPSHGTRPELWLSAEDRRQAHELLRQGGWRPGDTLICLGINAGHPRRRWPIDSFIRLAQGLLSTCDTRFLVVGGASDRRAADLMRPVLGARLINLAGRSPLRVSAAAIAECRLYVGNDSGPMHLAAAVGNPVVEISCHPADGDEGHFQAPERFGALAKPRVLLAPANALPPCHTTCLAREPHCITQVSVEQALQAVVPLIETRVSASQHD